MPDRGRTIRELVALALEHLGDPMDWLDRRGQHDAVEAHVIRWVGEYAQNRGVILEVSDVETELATILNEIRDGRPISGRPPDCHGATISNHQSREETAE